MFLPSRGSVHSASVEAARRAHARVRRSQQHRRRHSPESPAQCGWIEARARSPWSDWSPRASSPSASTSGYRARCANRDPRDRRARRVSDPSPGERPLTSGRRARHTVPAPAAAVGGRSPSSGSDWDRQRPRATRCSPCSTYIA